MKNATRDGFFYSNEISKDLEPKTRVLKNNVRKQMEDNDFNKGFQGSSQDTSSMMKVTLWAVFILNFVMAGAMSHMI